MNIALLTAAGSGTRMGQDIPKQFMTIDECPVFNKRLARKSIPSIYWILKV